jgi:hypothetical protein
MKNGRIIKLIGQMSRGESSGSHLAVGALLVVTILYATTII